MSRVYWLVLARGRSDIGPWPLLLVCYTAAGTPKRAARPPKTLKRAAQILRTATQLLFYSCCIHSCSIAAALPERLPLTQLRLHLPQPPHHLSSQVRHTQRVHEARVLRAGVHRRGAAELLEAAQALQRRRVQRGDGLWAEVHIVVQGVAEDLAWGAPGGWEREGRACGEGPRREGKWRKARGAVRHVNKRGMTPPRCRRTVLRPRPLPLVPRAAHGCGGATSPRRGRGLLRTARRAPRRSRPHGAARCSSAQRRCALPPPAPRWPAAGARARRPRVNNGANLRAPCRCDCIIGAAPGERRPSNGPNRPGCPRGGSRLMQRLRCQRYNQRWCRGWRAGQVQSGGGAARARGTLAAQRRRPCRHPPPQANPAGAGPPANGRARFLMQHIPTHWRIRWGTSSPRVTPASSCTFTHTHTHTNRAVRADSAHAAARAGRQVPRVHWWRRACAARPAAPAPWQRRAWA